MTDLIDRSCDDCDESAVVGFGSPPQWLCLAHFEARMTVVGSVIRQARDVLDGT